MWSVETFCIALQKVSKRSKQYQQKKNFPGDVINISRTLPFGRRRSVAGKSIKVADQPYERNCFLVVGLFAPSHNRKVKVVEISRIQYDLRLNAFIEREREGGGGILIQSSQLRMKIRSAHFR